MLSYVILCSVIGATKAYAMLCYVLANVMLCYVMFCFVMFCYVMQIHRLFHTLNAPFTLVTKEVMIYACRLLENKSYVVCLCLPYTE